jgi:shikimate kinase
VNLVLIGYRGTGKSTIGLRLAGALEMPYVCFDEEIVRRAGMTIPEIVAEGSWDRFRDLESEVVADFAARDGQVLDTGGGVVTRAENVAMLKENALIVLLEADVDDIVARIGSTTDRPSLSGDKSFVEEVEEVLQERRPLYETAADHRIDTSRLSEDEAVEAIVRIFRRVR